MVMNNLPNLHKPHNRFSPHKPYSPHNCDSPDDPYKPHNPYNPHNPASINSNSKKLPSQERRSSRSVVNQVLSVVAVVSTLTGGL